MTKHIMTNGIAINGTIGTVATTDVNVSLVAAHEVRLDVRSECERSQSEYCWQSQSADLYCDLASDSGKRLSKPLSAKQCCKAKPQEDGVFRNAGELPAPAWASFVMSRNDSYGSVSI